VDARGPNVEFRELEDWDELSAENTHTLVEIFALRPIREGEQWVADYGSEYRFDFNDDIEQSTPLKALGQTAATTSAVGAGDGVQPRNINKALAKASAAVKQMQVVLEDEDGEDEDGDRSDGESQVGCAAGDKCKVKEPIPPEGLAHKCVLCKKQMHGICGGDVAGQEGHGAGRLCSPCIKAESKKAR
jgi:hypothetical protein